jgi:hypothetical protein
MFLHPGPEPTWTTVTGPSSVRRCRTVNAAWFRTRSAANHESSRRALRLFEWARGDRSTGRSCGGGDNFLSLVISYDGVAVARTAIRVDVTLGTTEVVMSLLQEAGHPVSRNWLLERLKETGHTTSRARLNRALRFCLDLGLVVEGSKGMQWTHTTSPSLLRALAKGRRV